jgi:hypothetical protein
MWWLERKPELTAGHKRTLRALTVDESGPGTIRHDFAALLAFVRGRDLPLSKAYHLLPLKVLPAINALLSRPIEVRLQRPQLKSYPHIQGLYLLLRATGLGQIGETPARPALAVDEGLHDAWLALNPAEQYFTLLETWLLRGRPEIVGEHERFEYARQHFADCAEMMLSIPAEGLPIAGNDYAIGYVLYSPGRMSMALMELFGLLAVEHGQPVEGEGWQIARVHRTPWGEAVFALLYEELFSDYDKVRELEDAAQPPFGVLQPAFAPYVPQWQGNLRPPSWAFREGGYVFKATLWRGLWRQIAIDGGAPLDDLAGAILDAYAFMHDHLYRFSYRNRFGVEERINHPDMDEGPWADEVRVGDVPLTMGQSMTYLFDFGDQWEFEVTLERIDPPERAPYRPVILDGRGGAPEQYPSGDE